MLALTGTQFRMPPRPLRLVAVREGHSFFTRRGRLRSVKKKSVQEISSTPSSTYRKSLDSIPYSEFRSGQHARSKRKEGARKSMFLPFGPNPISAHLDRATGNNVQARRLQRTRQRLAVFLGDLALSLSKPVLTLVLVSGAPTAQFIPETPLVIHPALLSQPELQGSLKGPNLSSLTVTEKAGTAMH